MRAAALFGFLGAGKTSVLSHWLSAAGPPDALIVNEFGALGIDGPRLARVGVETVELSGGCICCELVGPLGDAVDALADQGAETLWIEASGLASPRGAVDALAGRCTLEAAVAVVDAARFSVLRRRLGSFYSDQVRGANAIILNKVDLATAAALDSARAGAAALNPGAPILLAVRGRVDPAIVGALAAPRAEGPEHRHVHADSCIIEAPAPLSRAGAESIFGGLPESVWRAKGSMIVDGAPAWVDYAAGRLDIAPAPEAPEPRAVAFIGAALDPAALSRAFGGAQASAAAANSASDSKRAS